MKTHTRWVMVGLAVVVLSLVAAVAMATVRRRSGDTSTGTTGTGTTGGGTGTDPASPLPIQPTPPDAEPCLQVSGRTILPGETLYSIGYTPMVLAPDSKAAIVLTRTTNQVVGKFTGKYLFNPNYFKSGNCFIEVLPAEGNTPLWVHPKHVFLK